MNKLKIYFVTVIALFITLVATAQTVTTAKEKKPDYVKSYVGLYGGISSPLSDFKKADYSNNKAGFAKRGVTFGLDGAVYFYRNLAIGASISFQDQGELTQDDANALATGYTESFKSDEATTTTVGRYHSFNAMIGPQYSFPLIKGFILDVRAQAGVIHNTTTPETTTLLSGTATQTATFYQRSAKENVFGYGGSAALRYKLGDGVSVVLKGNYINSKGPDITNDGRTVTTIGRYVIRQPITVFQSTLGINFMF